MAYTIDGDLYRASDTQLDDLGLGPPRRSFVKAARRALIAAPRSDTMAVSDEHVVPSRRDARAVRRATERRA